MIIVLMIILIPVFIAKGKIDTIKNDFSNPYFHIGLVTIIVFLLITYIYIKILREGDDEDKERANRMINAVRHGIIALFISYFAHLDMIFASFGVVYIFSYIGTKNKEWV